MGSGIIFAIAHWLSQKTTLESEITRALKHEKRIQEKLKKDRAEAERSDQYQWWGELIMAQLHKIKIHTPEVILEDVIRGNPEPQRVPLDPESTPLLNAQRYFKKAQKDLGVWPRSKKGSWKSKIELNS